MVVLQCNTKQKGLPNGNPLKYHYGNNTGLPYDFALSHHQLLFKPLIFIQATNMEIVLPKSKQKLYFYG